MFIKIKNNNKKYNKKADMQKSLDFIIYIGTAIYVLGIGIAFASLEKLITIFKQDKVEGILIVFLLISTIGWGIFYLYTAHNELELLSRFFNVKKISRIKPIVYFIVVFMTITFALLIGFPYNLLIYCILAIIFEIFDIWGATIIHKNLYLEYIAEIGEKDNKKDERKIIVDFYIKNPTFLRTTLILVSFFVALIILIQYTNKYISYIIMILTIICGNVLIQLWRSKRDEDLDEVEKQKKSDLDKKEYKQFT